MITRLRQLFICFCHLLCFSGELLGTDSPPEMPESVKVYLNGEKEYYHQAGLVIESSAPSHLRSLDESGFWILTPLQQRAYGKLPSQFSAHTSEILFKLLNSSLADDSFSSFIIVLPSGEYTLVPTRLETIGPQSAVILGHILGDDHSMVSITYTEFFYTLVIYPSNSNGVKISGNLTEDIATIQHIN